MPGNFDNFTVPVTSLNEETSELDAPIADYSSGSGSQIPPPPYKTLWSTDAQQASDGSLTTDYTASVVYNRLPGRYVYPVAGTDTTGSQAGVVIQEHCPVETAVISWVAIKSAGVPRIPPPPADPNFILVKSSIGNPTPVIGVGGIIRRFLISGTYVCQLKTPGAILRTYPGLGNSLDVTPRAQNSIPATAFDPSLTF